MKVGNVSLRVGDRIRFVRKPTDWAKLHIETKILFNLLINRGRSSRICEIKTNTAGVREAWIDCRFMQRGQLHYHSLAILDDGSWVKVGGRKTTVSG